jgi:hypothetical protein
MKLVRNGYIRDRSMFLAVSFGLKILREGRELDEAVRIPSTYYSVDAQKLRRHLVCRTGIPSARKRPVWPECTICARNGKSRLADYEIRSDKYYPDLRRSYEEMYGRHLDPVTPYLCENCYRKRIQPIQKHSLFPTEWEETAERIDPRRFQSRSTMVSRAS